LITSADGYSQVMTDPRNATEEPARDRRLQDEAEREEARKREERAVTGDEKESPQPFSGSDH
jgi:hypothetical protein